jgi:phage terminase small subunit
LEGIARLTWLRMVRSARPAGLLTDVDLPLLEAFCRAVGDLDAMRSNRPTEIATKDYREHMAMEHKTRTALSTMARLLGFAPQSRGSVRPSKPAVSDEGDEYFA